MNYKSLFLIFLVLCITNAAQFRYLQGWQDPNCSQWSDDGQTCLKCSWRSYNDTRLGRCIRVDDNCKTWDQTNGDCVTCYDSYGDAFYNGSAINGTCPYFNGTQPFPPTPNQQCDPFCRCYSQDHVCTECHSGYYLDQQSRCLFLPTGCRRVVNGTCVQCLNGFFLDSQSNCNQLQGNCSKGDLNGKCTQCDVGFFLTTAGECIVNVSNCAMMSSSTGECIECNQGYFLNQIGVCNILPPNCNATDINGTCIECQTGYVLDIQNQCQLLPPNCFFTDSNGICTQCVDGYYLDQNKQCQLLGQNCLSASPQGNCIQCADRFSLVNGECIRSSNVGGGSGGQVGSGDQQNLNCAQANSNNKCTKCRPFYNLKKGKCIPTGENPFCQAGACECGTGKCLNCQSGYFLDSSNVCTLIGQNCKDYSKMTGNCTSCQTNFTLVDGQCVLQTVNIVTNLNCKNQTQNGTCTVCRKYYKLQNGDCVPTGKNPKCMMWDQNKVCIACYYHKFYYLDNNKICSLKKQHCRSFDMQTGLCTKCNKKWILVQGECIPDKVPETTQNTKNSKE